MVLHFPANIKSQDGAACCVLRCSVFEYAYVHSIIAEQGVFAGFALSDVHGSYSLTQLLT